MKQIYLITELSFQDGCFDGENSIITTVFEIKSNAEEYLLEEVKEKTEGYANTIVNWNDRDRASVTVGGSEWIIWLEEKLVR